MNNGTGQIVCGSISWTCHPETLSFSTRYTNESEEQWRPGQKFNSERAILMFPTRPPNGSVLLKFIQKSRDSERQGIGPLLGRQYDVNDFIRDGISHGRAIIVRGEGSGVPHVADAHEHLEIYCCNRRVLGTRQAQMGATLSMSDGKQHRIFVEVTG